MMRTISTVSSITFRIVASFEIHKSYYSNASNTFLDSVFVYGEPNDVTLFGTMNSKHWNQHHLVITSKTLVGFRWIYVYIWRNAFLIRLWTTFWSQATMKRFVGFVPPYNGNQNFVVKDNWKKTKTKYKKKWYGVVVTLMHLNVFDQRLMWNICDCVCL